MKASDLALSKQILLDILDRGLPFRVASKNAFNKAETEPDTRRIISAIIGAELRHHILFTYLIEKEFKGLALKDYALLLILLSHQLYIKKENSDALLKYALAINKKENGPLFDSDFTNFLEKYNDMRTLIGDDVEIGSNKYLSLKYNTPEWLVGMWQKHFGPRIATRILQANIHHPNPVVHVNTLMNVSEEDLLKEKDVFESTPVKNVLHYLSRGSLMSNIHMQEFDAFPTSMGLSLALEHVDIDMFKPIAIFQGTPGENLFLEVAMKSSFDMNMDVMLGLQQDYNSVKKSIRKFGLMKASVYLMETSKFITAISNEVHTFFLMPFCSNFAEIRTTPDFILHFKQDQIDMMIRYQEQAIKDALDVIEDGGELVYIIPTLNNKEGHLLINKVVNENDNLTLLEEKQLFPFDIYETSLYFARILKGNKNED